MQHLLFLIKTTVIVMQSFRFFLLICLMFFSFFFQLIDFFFQFVIVFDAFRKLLLHNIKNDEKFKCKIKKNILAFLNFMFFFFTRSV